MCLSNTNKTCRSGKGQVLELGLRLINHLLKSIGTKDCKMGSVNDKETDHTPLGEGHGDFDRYLLA